MGPSNANKYKPIEPATINKPPPTTATRIITPLQDAQIKAAAVQQKDKFALIYAATIGDLE